MRQLVATFFDDFVHGTSSVYTASPHERVLATLHQVAIQAVADCVTGSSVKLTVAIEASSDGRNWVAKSFTPQIHRADLVANVTNVAVGTDDGATPSGCFVRLNVALEGTNPGCRLKLYVCGRGNAVDGAGTECGCSADEPVPPPFIAGLGMPPSRGAGGGGSRMAETWPERGDGTPGDLTGDIERAALIWLAEREPSMRKVVNHALQSSTRLFMNGETATRSNPGRGEL